MNRWSRWTRPCPEALAHALWASWVYREENTVCLDFPDGA